MLETLSIQEMYNKYHALWPQYSPGSPTRGALCTIAFNLSCALDGRANLEQCITGLVRDRDADDAGVRYLYHPVIRDLRAMLTAQEVAAVPDEEVMAALPDIFERILADQKSGESTCLSCGSPLDERKEYSHVCQACHDTACDEEEEPSTLTCNKCGGQFESLLASPKGWLCEHCHYAADHEDENEQETTPEDAHKHLDQLSESRVGRLVADACERLNRLTDWEEETPEGLKEMRDNWALVQALMPRYIEQYESRLSAVPVTCQCVLCQE